MPQSGARQQISALCLAAGIGTALGMLDVVLVADPTFESSVVGLRTLSLVGAVQGLISILGALLAWACASGLARLMGRRGDRVPVFGFTLSSGVLVPLALVLLKAAHRSSDATVFSRTGLLITAGVALAGLVSAALLALALQCLRARAGWAAIPAVLLTAAAALAGVAPTTHAPVLPHDVVLIS
ncbi:MAG: hypothetical protein GXP62_09265, partial [Oligoflexia bacterium]|nr:hypothetical protein [Oligoflexia bacterium]